MFLKELSEEFDNLNPIDRFISIKKTFFENVSLPTSSSDTKKNTQLCDIGEIILLSLYAIDFVIRKNLEYSYYFYINDDLSVKNIIEKALSIKFPDEIFLKSIMYIDYSKLIYRFTCAKKFNITNYCTKQLRLNSWGREYIISEKLLEKHELIYGEILKTFTNCFNKNRDLYMQLTKKLLMEINDNVSKEISNLNDKLEIKLLS